MSQLGVFLARQELRVVFDNFDLNKDGNIAYSEFVSVLKVSASLLAALPTLNKQEFNQLFKASTAGVSATSGMTV